jgi:pyruvyltransferase
MTGIDLYWWNEAPNFGDALSQAVVQWATDGPVHHVPKEHSPKLLAVGSILHYAVSGDTVWGAGMHPWAFHRYFKRLADPPSLNILAVRGPLTRDAMLTAGIPCPAIFGDPAILLPMFQPASTNKIQRLGLVPHLKDRGKIGPHPFIDVTQDWQTVVTQITACETIVSSSLHGIIVAEAYGIPAVWLRASTTEGALKFYDYYLSTGRAPLPIYDLETALTADAPPLPDLRQMQIGLSEAIASWLNH